MSKWINVKNKLPDTTLVQDIDLVMSEPVLVFNSKQQVARRVYDDFDCMFYWRSTYSEGWVLTGVTHWQSLPANPKE